ncbi:protein NLP1-like isoform X1 [Canna indica]|uniref:Protein NLP1-like isoform X1 n=1 Tax=Canna indica TaxID=4628 RepID=A0AAQ3QMK4_9LILI|nr:protein NLP1-like isoform X1 [Canna indica]
MEDSVHPTGGFLGQILQDAAVDFDLFDELLSGSAFDCPDLLQTSSIVSSCPFSSSGFSPVLGISSGSPNLPLSGIDYQVDAERSVFSMELASDESQRQMLDGGQPINLNPDGVARYSTQQGELEVESLSYQQGMSWQIQPKGPVCSVEQRLNCALRYIKEAHKDDHVLVQIWVPVMRGNRQVLTTCGQPFSLDFSCQSLVNYRSVSTRYQFLADENSHEAVGLPGRVFLGKLPEWTPDVRYFSSSEYPRVSDAQRYDVRGTIALPIFEKDKRTCLGVIEVVMTTQKVNYSSDIENICNALHAVDLKISNALSVPRLKMSGDSYQAALPEIQMVLRASCESHNLPLAQTWISCIQQGKKGSRHSDENFKDCISTVDEACFVQDPSMMGFQQACSEHHMFRGEGVAGRAFMTNQPCFSSDITQYSKTEYPLSHHAKVFHLRAAVAIRLRCIHTGKLDFVLEFFLPVHCIKNEDQKLMLNSLSITIQQVCQSLRVVTAKELEDEELENNEQIPSAICCDKSVYEIGQRQIVDRFLPAEAPPVVINRKASSWAGRMESQEKVPKNVTTASLSMEPRKQEFEGFSISTQWDPSDVVVPAGKIFSEFKQHLGDSDNDYRVSFSADTSVSNLERAAEKRRTKTEKNVGLQELQKYFAGSLKDAAKSLGVCPTTLKRICRQHGITRWPSRKIKKVGHSLKKLQVVIDSVHGPGGSIQFSNLYDSFIKTTWSDNNLATDATASLSKQNDHPDSNANQQLEGRYNSHTSGSHSLTSSSCSQNSNSSQGCSSEQKQCNNSHEFGFGQDTSADKKQSGMVKKARSQLNLHSPNEEALKPVLRPEHQNLQIDSSGNISFLPLNRCDFLKVKAIYGEEKVIFRLHPAWGFQDLKQEIQRRFSIADASLVDLKYLDDDSEWVLITCDEDLMECIDVYKSTNAHTVKLSVHLAQPTTRSSLGSTALS